MKRFSVLFLAAVILSCSGQSVIYKLCPKSFDILTFCENDHGINEQQRSTSLKFFDFQNQIDNENFQPDDLSAMCPGSSAAEMKSFMGCLHTEFFSCINPDSEKAFPDISKVKSSLDQVCQHLSDIDVPCLASPERRDNVFTCLPKKPTGESSEISTAEGYLAHYCSLFDAFVPCFKAAYDTCPGKTAEVWAQVLQNAIPTGCNNARMMTPSWILSIFVVFSISIGLK